MAPEGDSLRLGSQGLDLPEHLRGDALARYRDREVTVGFRPEHLHLASGSAGTAADGTRLVGEVELVEALGSEKLIHFRTDAERVHETEAAAPTARGEGGDLSAGEIGVTLAATGVARVAPESEVKDGDRVEFALDTAHLKLFDPTDGAAIG